MTIYAATLQLELQYANEPGLVVVPGIPRVIVDVDIEAATASAIASLEAEFRRREAAGECPAIETLTVTVASIEEARRA